MRHLFSRAVTALFLGTKKGMANRSPSLIGTLLSFYEFLEPQRELCPKEVGIAVKYRRIQGMLILEVRSGEEV